MKIKTKFDWDKIKTDGVPFFIGIGLLVLHSIIKTGFLARANMYILGFGLAKTIVRIENNLRLSSNYQL